MKKPFLVFSVALALILPGVTCAAVWSTTTISSTAVAITSASSYNFSHCYCGVESNPIRCRWDGTDPTASVGLLISAGSFITLDTDEVTRFKAIATGSDATLNCMCR